MIRGMNSMIAREPYIAGYPDRLSYLPGEEVSFACSTNARYFSAEIARVGGQRQIVWERKGLAGHAVTAVFRDEWRVMRPGEENRCRGAGCCTGVVSVTVAGAS